MNNFNNFLDLDKIDSQLERAEIQKSRIIFDMYKEYELYLDIARDLLYFSVEKGIRELYRDLSIKDDSFNAKICLFEKNIGKLIYRNLPLLTIEQLKINEIEKNISKEINFNSLGSSIKINNDHKEKFQYKDGGQLDKSVQFQISKDICNSSEYYHADKYEKILSLDLDNNDHNSYLFDNNAIENIGLEKQFISSLLELIEEVKLEKPRHPEKGDINKIDNSTKYRSLKIFDLIDKSLGNLLLNLSYNINQELFKANIIKKMISKDSYEYLVGKKFFIKYPYPFVINFKFNFNQSSSNSANVPSIFFFNISTVELEFENLNLSIQRNKINELKNQFQRLMKKETYWRQKQITLNKIR